MISKTIEKYPILDQNHLNKNHAHISRYSLGYLRELPILKYCSINTWPCNHLLDTIAFSSLEPMILLACGRNRELLPDPIFWVWAEYSFRILNQSDCQIWWEVCESQTWTKPELSILATGQEDHALWGWEWYHLIAFLSCYRDITSMYKEPPPGLYIAADENDITKVGTSPE